MKLLSFIAAAIIFTTGCASVNSLSVTQIPAKRDKIVKSQASKLIFLAFNFDNDFVEQVTDDLKSQCPNGKVSGILTKDETILYFLFFVYKKQVTVTGYCDMGKA
ncbi:MAG: hypothetical protein A4S09_01830 [Proteobacteria bacterium SG_bin7]|nr:MAG: hypothetical protein A4S09_01830 [Proteobacteria bacterium SG_bin7]